MSVESTSNERILPPRGPAGSENTSLLPSNDVILKPRCPKLGEINIFHPGYQDRRVPLLRLIGCDTAEGGLWRDVAHTACAIVSNNRFDGHLKNEQDEEVNGDILLPGNYTWHVPPPENTKYAVIADFRLWPFPRDVPDLWQTLSLPVEQAANHCCVTRQQFGKEKAHIIPQGETEWFETNAMGTLYSYDNRSNSVDDSDNIISLRSDLHTGLDQKLFAFFPKEDKIMLHCMDRDASIYHNTTLCVDVRKEFLLARFAWTIFPICLLPWLKMKQARLLWVEENGSLIQKEVSGEGCQAIAHSSVPKSTSPKKKRKNEDIPYLPPSDPSKRRSSSSFDSGLGLEDSDEDTELKSLVDWEERTRGRKRLRGDR